MTSSATKRKKNAVRGIDIDRWKGEDGTDRLSRNVGKELPLSLCNSPEERSSYLAAGYRSGELLK